MMSSAIDYRVQRRAYSQDEFDAIYKCEKRSTSVLDRVKGFGAHLRKTRPSSVARQFFPILRWGAEYKPFFLINDLIAGVTVAILSVPQAMAYATLANIPPVIGLYTAFFAPIIYAFFGTSKHISLGMFAVVALMVGSAVQGYVVEDHTLGTTANDLGNMPVVQAAATITFLIGVTLAAMSLLQLHFIAAYMSDALVSGFTTASATHVCASQLPKLFGMKIPSHSGLFKLFYVLRDFILTLPKTNLPDLIVSVICILFLFIGKLYINPWVRKRTRAPIPFELILVIATTAASNFLNFSGNYHMAIVSHIPTGFPTPRAPNMEMVPNLLANAIVISVVVFAISISVAKLFAKRHHYHVDCSQELRAISVVQLLISFLLCHPASGSLTRGAINSECHCHSLVSSFVSSSIIIVVILWAGPLFEPLPMCVLASIIVVALSTMILQLRGIPKLWRISRVDLAIYLVSCVVTICWDVSEGLGVAIAFALITVIFRSQWPKSVMLVQVGDTELYRDLHRYQVKSRTSNILIYRFDAPLLFLNCENFKDKAISLVEKHERELAEVSTEMTLSTIEESSQKVKLPSSCSRTKFLVLDASGFTQIDPMGVTAIKELAEELQSRGIDTLVASCKAQVRETCERCELYASLPKRHFFPSIHDAVLHAIQKDESSSCSSISIEGDGDDTKCF